jgi:integrase
MASKKNCTINGIDYYRIRKKVGVKQNKNGKWVPDMKPFYGKNKTDAERQWEEWKEAHKRGINKDEYFGKLMQYFMEDVFLKGKHADGTKIRYNGVYNKYLVGNEILNQNRMNEINGIVIQSLFNGFKPDMTYSTKIAIKNVLTLFFDWTEIQGYCSNPMKAISIERNKKKIEHNEIVVFTKEEAEKIAKIAPNAQHSYNHLLFRLALGTGLREGELLALTFGDITKDWQIRVVKQVITDLDKKRSLDDTKTQNSIRYVPIPNALRGELEERRKGNADSDHIFLTKNGNFIDASNLTRSYKRFLKNIGVGYKEFHTMRRTYATMLLEKGVDINRVAKLMGDTIAVVSQYYAAVSDKSKVEAADKINELFL